MERTTTAPDDDESDDDGSDDDGSDDDGPSPNILSVAATVGEGPTSQGVVTFEIAVEIAVGWAVSGIDADNFLTKLGGHAEGEAQVRTPLSEDGGYTCSLEVDTPAGEYELELTFVVDAGISAVSPTGETADGPDTPETAAEAELVVDRAGPDIRAAFVMGDRLHIAFAEATGDVDPAAFTVTAGGEALTILSVEISREGAAIFILSRPVVADDSISLAHAGGGAKDALGNAAPGFEARPIHNLARPVADPEGADDDDVTEADGDFVH
jgi:hypothetical protein